VNVNDSFLSKHDASSAIYLVKCCIYCPRLPIASSPESRDWLPTNHVKCSEPLSLSPHSH